MCKVIVKCIISNKCDVIPTDTDRNQAVNDKIKFFTNTLTKLDEDL